MKGLVGGGAPCTPHSLSPQKATKLFARYLQPAIVAPRAGIYASAAGAGLHCSIKRLLGDPQKVACLLDGENITV